MEYFIQQKILTVVRKKYEIQDAEGKVIYQAKSSVMFPFKITICDLNEKPLMVIKKRYFRIFPRYDVHEIESKITLLKIKAKFGILEKRFNITSTIDELNNLKAHGDIIGLKFQLMKGNEVAATIGKKILSVGDKYSLTINSKENKLLYFAIVLILDNIVHNKKIR